MSSNDESWGVRLADIRVSRYWPIGVIVGIVIGTWLNRRAQRELEDVGTKLGTYMGERDQQAAQTQAGLVKLTKILAGLTAALVLNGAATILLTLAVAS